MLSFVHGPQWFQDLDDVVHDVVRGFEGWKCGPWSRLTAVQIVVTWGYQ